MKPDALGRFPTWNIQMHHARHMEHAKLEEDSDLTDVSEWKRNQTSNKQEVSLKKIIVEGYRAVGSLNDSFQSSNFLLLLLFFIDFGQW